MSGVNRMPYDEKYAMVIDHMKFDESFILPFVQKHLGDQAVVELNNTWQEGIGPIPEAVSFEEKYEVAYANWIWCAKTIYPFIRKRMGEDGLREFERAEIDGLVKKNDSPALLMLRIIRAFSPGTAFKMTAKQLGYQFQWLTPFSVSELTKRYAVLSIPRCKVLDFSDTEDICFVGCQSTYPKWVAEQFRVEMKFDRQGNGCRGTLAPLN